uniref:Uncharacterized protein n=1 Tax=Cairina moschata TaxID=8855 RepID=A0A8C3D641_CAIMO
KMRGCTAWWQITPRCSVGPVSAHACVLQQDFELWAHHCSVGDKPASNYLALCWPFGLEKQQWQQMKMEAMRTTKGRPISTTRQTVLKTPSLCLVRMSSKTELKKELIFCSMLPPGQQAPSA